ncbi:uncharacterized protein LOC144443021 [Glandiceps talaboti]
MDKSSDPKPSTRVMLWCHPRSRSTAFELSMASVPAFKVFHEPFVVADLFGEERRDLVPGPVVPGFTFKEARESLEVDFPGKSAVFVKDSPNNLRGNMDNLPSGYIHTFIIRNQRKAVISNFNNNMNVMKGLAPYSDIIKGVTDYSNLTPMFELFKYVTETLKQKPIVIESDDLLRSPQEILQRYCSETGLSFTESMLNWKPGNISFWFPKMQQPYFVKYYKTAVASSCFLSPQSSSSTSIIEEDTVLPEEILKLIEFNQPMYTELIKYKIQI